jgi:dTDP-4-dehydrorhamnose 3,5-epimerase
MTFAETDIPGVILIEPDVHYDSRGFFLETYHARKYVAGGIPLLFVQDNQSLSSRDTIHRGSSFGRSRVRSGTWPSICESGLRRSDAGRLRHSHRRTSGSCMFRPAALTASV